MPLYNPDRNGGGIINNAPVSAIPVTTDGDGNLGDLSADEGGSQVSLNVGARTLKLQSSSGIRADIGAAGELVIGDTEGAGAFIGVFPGDQYIDIDPQTGGTLHLGHGDTQVRVDVGSKSINIDTPVADGMIFMSAGAGVVQQVPTATPAALLGNAQIAFFLDEAGDKLKVAVKYSNGTAKTGEIPLG